jgi:hypothetical protein
MITENEVVEAMVSFFKKKRFYISQSLSTNQKGVDIIAESPEGITYFIEAKGGTSSKPNTARHGKPFDKKQAYTHISVAITKCFQKLQESSNKCIAGIALPKDENHVSIIKSIEEPLRKTELKVYLVNQDKKIEEYI